jgi:hypothetical protein
MVVQGCKVDMYNDVPLGNSIFQIRNFTDGCETPQRRYRHCFLQLRQKMIALRESQFRRKRLDVDIQEIIEKLKTATNFEHERLEVDLEEKQFYLDIEIKLIDDCMVEIAAYKTEIDCLPKFTREEFENGEADYWEKRLLNNARREMISTGTVSTETIAVLERIGFMIGRNEKNQITYARKEKEVDKNGVLCVDQTDN